MEYCCLPHVCPKLADRSDWVLRYPCFSLSLCSLKSVTMCFACHCPRLSCFHFCLTTFDFLMGLSQWPSDLVLHFNQFLPQVHPCLHASLPFWWVYRARAPSQCVSNYMFLLEAPASCVASPFVSAARLGPDQRPRSQTPSPPTTQKYHYHASLAFMANRCHVRNDTDMLVWPLCLAGVVIATRGLPFRLPWPKRCGMCVPTEECHPGQF